MTRCLSQKNVEQRKNNVRVKYNLKCEYKTHGCLYVVDCKPTGQGVYLCNNVDHFTNYLDVCCNFVC